MITVLSVLSIAAAVWVHVPVSDLIKDEDERPALICQWSVTDAKSGVSITQDLPSEMTVEELLEAGMAFSVEQRKVLQCQPLGMSPSSEPTSTGTYVFNEH